MNFLSYIIFNILLCQCIVIIAAQDGDSNPQTNVKEGQCPYLLSSLQHSNIHCTSDDSCSGTEKCCSNGSGKDCMNPLFFTVCQHQHEVAEYHIKHSLVSSSFVPQCNSDGSFVPLQCDSSKNECWCVDFRGFEISQSRAPSQTHINCSTISYSGNCPLYNCVTDCDHGFAIDKSGCRTCTCLDPCSNIKCKEATKICQLFTVKCTKWPCPPVPMCLPKPN